MGSTMKQSIFDEQTSKALKSWHKNAKKKPDGKNPGDGNEPVVATNGDKSAPSGGGQTNSRETTLDVAGGNRSSNKEDKEAEPGKQPLDLLTGS
ncbi:MLO-like protein 5 [Impatiens glandulifera]|uniref:MLO-like protein 5 n=1 Tax=Impatiens glandulifera TaxID=253017 RepID=UPI001FB18968|nr:MLO-like protein 5 [Impatiens glandulifera]